LINVCGKSLKAQPSKIVLDNSMLNM